jgi:hypothetical protein
MRRRRARRYDVDRRRQTAPWLRRVAVQTPGAEIIPAAPVVAGVILAAAGGLLELVVLAGNECGGGLTSGLNGGALGNALATRPGKLALAILIALAAAGVLARVRSLRMTAIVPLLAAVVFNADLGHRAHRARGGWSSPIRFISPRLPPGWGRWPTSS